jgi:hypothetical protein
MWCYNIWVFWLACEAGLGDYTAETRSKEFLIKKFSDLCELGASVVNTSSQKTWDNRSIRELTLT